MASSPAGRPLMSTILPAVSLFTGAGVNSDDGVFPAREHIPTHNPAANLAYEAIVINLNIKAEINEEEK